ncbi:hypothetical protein bcere0027_51690 [Bacillus cereus AH676]|nr:hypothetical protein bcere0027_51690 [Bacillus cereus AH676]KZD40238.1 hypothetical protein B4081_0356 [Bacillus cereus]
MDYNKKELYNYGISSIDIFNAVKQKTSFSFKSCTSGYHTQKVLIGLTL